MISDEEYTHAEGAYEIALNRLREAEEQYKLVKLVFRIKVEIPNPNMELKPGMPAEADMLLDQIQGGK